VTFRIQVQNVLNNQQLKQLQRRHDSPFFFGKANSARNPRQVEAGLRFQLLTAGAGDKAADYANYADGRLKEF